MLQATAIVFDRDQTERDDIRNRLTHCSVLPICFQDEWICLENIHYIRPAFAVLRTDSSERAFRFVNLAKAIKSNFPVIVLSTNDDVERFARNNWLANLFFLRYPADDESFQAAIGMMNGTGLQPDRPVMITGNPDLRKRFADIPRIGTSDEPLLILGEGGVGKKLLAKAVFSRWSDRGGILEFKRAVDLSATWIQQTRHRIDDHNQANGNRYCVVVEHIEDLTWDMQSQLLLLLDARINVNGAMHNDRRPVRWITLAGRPIGELVRHGRFRKDLYHRLSVLRLAIPPLRSRIDDVPMLADYFTAQHSIRSHKGIARLPDEIRTALKRYHWPGNVAELKRTINTMMHTDELNWMEALPPDCQSTPSNHIYHLNGPYVDPQELRQFLDDNRDISLKKVKNRYSAKVEKKIMKAVLATTNGNRKKAAELLSISYKTMLTKTKLYDMG